MEEDAINPRSIMPRKHEISLDDLNPLDLDPTTENVELVRRGLAKLDNKRLVWGGVLDAWEKQLGLSTAAPESIRREVIVRPRENPKPEIQTLNLVAGSIPAECYSILSENPRPMTYHKLEEELIKRGVEITEFNKPQYNAVQRLRAVHFVVEYKNHLTTPGNLKKFLEDIAAGRAEDVTVQRVKNKWAEAILNALESFPNGATTEEIIARLNATLPDFAKETGKLSPTYIYGVVGKLERRDGLIEGFKKDGKARVYRLRKPVNAAAQGSGVISDDAPPVILATLGEGSRH